MSFGRYFRTKVYITWIFYQKISDLPSLKERLKTLYSLLYVMSVWYTDEPIKIANFILTQENDYHEEVVRRIHCSFHHLNSSSQVQIQTRQHGFIVFDEYVIGLNAKRSSFCKRFQLLPLFGRENNVWLFPINLECCSQNLQQIDEKKHLCTCQSSNLYFLSSNDNTECHRE